MSQEKVTTHTSAKSADHDVFVELRFNVHSSCYIEFFLLRTPITINYRPAVIKVVNGEPVLRACGISVKLSTIHQNAVALVASKHGIYQVDNFYYEKVPLFSVKFSTKSSLKQFLTEKEKVQEELSLAITNLFKMAQRANQPQSFESPSMEPFHVAIDVKVYLVSPALGRTPKVHQINIVNHSFMIETWKRSKLFDFSSSMFDFNKRQATTIDCQTVVSTSESSLEVTSTLSSSQTRTNGSQNAEVAALQVELRGVTEWFSLGVQLKIPTDELMTIRKDHRYTYDCRLEMLIRWEQLEKPTWSKLITALVNIGRRDLAEKVAKKYGISIPPATTHVHLPLQDSEVDIDTDCADSGESLSLLEEEVERATQSRDAVSKALVTDIETTLPELQMKVSTLNETVALLKTKLKNREDENKMLDEANQNLSIKWNETIQHTQGENSKSIKLLREEIKRKEDELVQTKVQLADKEKELSEKMKELDIKSVRVLELKSELEEMRQKFSNQQEAMDQKLIESKALALSHERYLEEMQIQRDIAVKEACKKKEEIQSFSQELSKKEEQISQLSEKIAEQERDMIQLRQQLSTGELKEDDEREQQLLTLTMSAMKLQLELRMTKEKENQDKMKLEGAKKAVEKYEKIITTVEVQSSDCESIPGVISSQCHGEEQIPPLLPSVDVETTLVQQDPLSIVVALYDYTGRDDQDLPFKKGDILQVTEKKFPDWWYAMDSDGRQGYIPEGYVKIQGQFNSSGDDLLPEAPAPPPSSSSLPLGWTEHKTSDGHIYYHNSTTGESSWTRPQPPPTVPKETQKTGNKLLEKVALRGWTKEINPITSTPVFTNCRTGERWAIGSDGAGNTYYYNMSNPKLTVGELPEVSDPLYASISKEPKIVPPHRLPQQSTSPGDIKKDGYLQRKRVYDTQGKKVKGSWQKLFVMLHNHELHFYLDHETKDLPGAKPLCVFSLVHSTISPYKAKEKIKNVFQVSAPLGEQFLLQAETAVLFNEWYSTIQTAIYKAIQEYKEHQYPEKYLEQPEEEEDGNIPLRQLVYRVLDLPPSMRPLVYDFGQLKQGTEGDYIKQIVHDHIFRKRSRLSLFAEDVPIEPVIIDVLAASQLYMRGKQDECSFVSLRDVKRAMIVFEYFFEKIDDFRQADREKKKDGKGLDQLQEHAGTLPYHDLSVCELEKQLEQQIKRMNEVDGNTDEQLCSDTVTQIAHQDQPTIESNQISKDELSNQISNLKKLLKEQNLLNTTTALILAVSVCYHARLLEREEYEKVVASKFVDPIPLPGAEVQFTNEIVWCQTVLLDNMELGKNIAKNAALRENVFMMTVCIELRIPLFLVGKPGSSKSLAKSIIQDSMHGKTSRSNLLKKFKHVQMLSYQCSQLATPENVIEVFKSAKKFQSSHDQDTSMYVSVVVLDEVGLAEDSPNLPLKALHSLLEDGTEGAGTDGRDEVIEREKRVAFIDISNWALDPAKMNRGVMVIRGSPDVEELKFSAEGICGKEADDTTKEKLEPYFKDLAKAYEAICAKQDREFFGLRDFYSLIKMLYWMCKNSKGHQLTWAQLEHAIKRNFGGLETSEWNPFYEFRKRLNLPDEQLDRTEYDQQTWELINPSCSRLGLIKTSLATKETTFHGENRYLLFLTENYAALDILEHYIRGKEQEGVQLPVGTGPEAYTGSNKATLKPFTLFGSSFPKDKEYTQVCRNINQIKICMETGRTVILLNLENLYESLYDVLNQYYMRYGDNRYVDLGLQTHRVKCRVHKDFKLILIAERHTVYEKFPTPLINRLEKHFVLTSSVLKEWQVDVLEAFQDWIREFSVIRDDCGKRNFKEGQAFIGYQKDTPAAVVFQASKKLKQLKKDLESISREQKRLDEWKFVVLKLSQILLLQIASDDALIRLKRTTLAEQQEDFLELYFSQQYHSSVTDLVHHYIKSPDKSREGLLLQVTTHGHLLQREEIETVGEILQMRVKQFPVLQEFDTELDFTNKLSPLFQGDEDCLVIIQCDAGHVYGDLIACARYRIYDERVNALKKNKIQNRAGVTHVLLIINLPHHVSSSSFVGFQGDPWVSYHIDDLMPTVKDTIEPVKAIRQTISELFIGSYIATVGVVPQPSPAVESESSSASLEKTEKTHTNSTSSVHDDMKVVDIEYQVEDLEEYGVEHIITPYGQCRRLYGCIQAAASRLEDLTKDRSTQRVSRLTKLIPRNPADTLDLSSFYGVLVMHLYHLLQEREAIRPDLDDWVLSEALDVSKLEVGGTFRNVLARKIDEVVIPIFAKIIACIDCNYNLDLIDPKAENLPRSQFWLAMFREPEVLQLKYSEMAQGDTVPGLGVRKANKDFRCNMPFFWLVKEAIDCQWDSARSTTDTNKESNHSQLCEFVKATHVGEILESVNPENAEDFYQYYLHDFVRSVHTCKHRNSKHDDQEYQLLSDALNHLVCCSEVYQQSLTTRITALHIVHWENRSQILWFSQLVSHSPSIMNNILQMSPRYMIAETEFHLYAAIGVIEKMEPPLQKENPNPSLIFWLNQMRHNRIAIQSILMLKSRSKLVDKARCGWQRLHATQLFVEHVMLAHPEIDLKISARRMAMLWERNADFLQAKTIKSVQLQLNSLERMLKKDGNDKHTIKQVKKSCRQFFIQLVSELSFGGSLTPEPELVKMLLGTIFLEKHESTQELTPYKDDKSATDKIPTIRSFLLQLLLEHSLDELKGHLHDYLDRSHHVLSVSVDKNLYLLIIQCLEDSLTRKFTTYSFPSKVNYLEAASTLLEGYYALLETRFQKMPSFQYLEGVAKVRFGLSVVVEVLNREDSIQFKQLLKAGEKVCSDHQINCIDTTGRKNIVGPVIYLLKLMVRQYGMPCLKAAAETREWLIPYELKSEEEKMVDQFVIYDETYKKLKESINDAMYANQIEELGEATKNLKSEELVYLVLAFYEKVTLSRTSSNPGRRINNEALQRLNEFVLNLEQFSNELRLTARALLANQQGGRVLEQMRASPEQNLHCRIVMGLVVHAATVFFGRQNLDILLPFVKILNNPDALKNSFLPTMPEDQLVVTQDAIKASDPNGKFYECPCGHKYFVGDFGGVVSTGECNVCRAPIGGRDYNLQQDNRPANLYDTTKTGHDLGDPKLRTDTTPERDLSPRAVCILRSLMHSAFIWAICNNDQSLGDIVALVNHRIQPQQLPEFFWSHLEKDIELLGKDANKGLEESAMIIHLVLRQILVSSPPTDAGSVLEVTRLSTKEDRKRWEMIFNQNYIQPILANLDNNLTAAMDIVAKDDQQDHSQLFFLVYEKVKHVDDSLEPHMWTYRSRITIEHLRQSIYDKKLTQMYPILHEFLQAELDLRATQYLPEVVHLQQSLYDKFNRQIDRKHSKKQTVALFIQNLPNESVKKNYRMMIGCLKTAWNLVGHKLKNHGRIPVEEKFFIAQIDESTPMEYLVPTTSEAGVCTTALVDYLTLKHNNFIERCRSLVADDDQCTSSFWREHKVPIAHLHHCHLVNYEQKLSAIILSHCHYSLKCGKGQDIKYDYVALEKHILNQFIHGKPLIILDIPQVVYKRGIYTTNTFAAVRKRVSPQEMLPQRIRQDILTELCSPDCLRESLDVVEIVLGFLSSGGGKAEKPLGEYVDKTLRMRKRQFSTKAKIACQLKHVLSLWATIAVELARQLCLREQEPFDFIDQTFLRPLSQDEDGENQFTALDSCLGQFDPNNLLGTLYEFIETYVKHCPLQEHREPLVVTLGLILEWYGIELPHLEEFPASIKLGQAVAAWKHIVHHYAQNMN